MNTYVTADAVLHVAVAKVRVVPVRVVAVMAVEVAIVCATRSEQAVFSCTVRAARFAVCEAVGVVRPVSIFTVHADPAACWPVATVSVRVAVASPLLVSADVKVAAVGAVPQLTTVTAGDAAPVSEGSTNVTLLAGEVLEIVAPVLVKA